MKNKPKPQPNPLKRARVTSISVSRVYNTGNYTNVKYEIGAEVPKGGSAVQTLRDLVHTIQMLKPVRKPDCIERLKEIQKKTLEEQSAYEKEHAKEWAEEAAEYHQRCHERLEAIFRLDELGGAATHRDAKQSWDNYDDDTPF